MRCFSVSGHLRNRGDNVLKKITIYIIIIAVVFCGGFLAGGINPGKRATELANDIDSIKSQLAKQTERNLAENNEIPNSLKKTAVSIGNKKLAFPPEPTILFVKP